VNPCKTKPLITLLSPLKTEISTFGTSFSNPKNCGYKIEGEIFIIKPIGFHYLMTKYFD
jgi:hypothetical protein